jgi:predicted PurR-regulated permease PerM
MSGFLSKLIGHPNFLRWMLVYAITLSLCIGIIHSLSGVLAPFLAGAAGAYLLDKLARRMEKYMSRTLAACVLMLTVVIALILISSVVLPYAQTELILLVQGLPQFAERLLEKVKSLLPTTEGAPFSVSNIKGQISTYLGDIMKWSVQVLINLLTNGILLANVLSLVILTPIIMFYLLRDWGKLITILHSFLPQQSAPTVRSIFNKIDKTLTAYLIGQTTVCVVLSLLYTCGLILTGIEKPWLLGIMSGILSFIPYLGMAVGLLASLSIAFTSFIGWGQIIAIIIVFFTVSLIEGNILTPRFVGSRIGLHPVWILFALLAGGTWLGFAGILIAIPTAAVVGVLVREIISAYRSMKKIESTLNADKNRQKIHKKES